MPSKEELIVPPQVEAADSAFEIARVWVANGGQHVSLAIGLWDDPSAWGIVLADLASHVANAYGQAGRFSKDEAPARIYAFLDAERASPTDTPKGDFVE